MANSEDRERRQARSPGAAPTRSDGPRTSRPDVWSPDEDASGRSERVPGEDIETAEGAEGEASDLEPREPGRE